MPENWFVYAEREDMGPYGPQELLKLVRDGTIREETLLRKNDSVWTPAREVGGLFEAAERPTIEYYCPECGHRVGKPPTYCRKCEKSLQRVKQKVTEHVLSAGATKTATAPVPAQNLGRLFRRK